MNTSSSYDNSISQATNIPLILKEGKFSLKDILLAIPNAVFATDKEMRIIYFNHIVEKLTGFKASEAIGMYCRDVIKSNLCEDNCLIKRIIDSHKNIFHVKSEIISAGGKKIPILASTSFLRNNEGTILGYLIIFQDISQLEEVIKKLEEAKSLLAERNRSLKLAYKRLKLVQEQLVESQKMESLARLAGGLAHHFNNILFGILGYLHLLKNHLKMIMLAKIIYIN